MIQYLGNINGPVLAFGGIYSNLQALEALKAEADALGIPPTNNVCTGDLAGYCAQPIEVFQLVNKWGIRAIAGNVEVQLRDEAADCGCDFRDGSRCDVFSRQWYPYTNSLMTDDIRDWLHALPTNIVFTFQRHQFVVVHGAYRGISDYVFRSTPWAKKAETMDATGTNGVIAGHCGLPFHHVQDGRYWLNPGVIGMPANDGNTSVWYMVLWPEGQDGFRIEHRQLSYDFATASQRMLDQQLPSEYAQTLRTGIWDNCEILPPEETALQGQPIEFDVVSG